MGGFDWETYVRREMSERRGDAGGMLIVSHFLTERERLDPGYRSCATRERSRLSAVAVSSNFVREQLECVA